MSPAHFTDWRAGSNVGLCEEIEGGARGEGDHPLPPGAVDGAVEAGGDQPGGPGERPEAVHADQGGGGAGREALGAAAGVGRAGQATAGGGGEAEAQEEGRVGLAGGPRPGYAVTADSWSAVASRGAGGRGVRPPALP